MFLRESIAANSHEGKFLLQLEQYMWTRKGNIIRSFRLKFKSNQNCKMVWEEKPLKEPKNGYVYAFNPRYGFDLKRKTNDDPWVVSDLHIGPFRGSQEHWEDFTALHICISVHLYELPELIRLPNFRVVKASTIQRGGMELCQIDFNSKQAEGVLLLDPNRFWVLLRCDIRSRKSDQAIVVRQDMELRAPVGKYPIPQRLVMDKEWWTGAKMKREPVRGIIDFDLKEASSPPDEREFTLSAFGLPEPVGVEPLPR